MFCTQCGKKLEDGMKFCTQCGARVVSLDGEKEEGCSTAESAVRLAAAGADDVVSVELTPKQDAVEPTAPDKPSESEVVGGGVQEKSSADVRVETAVDADSEESSSGDASETAEMPRADAPTEPLPTSGIDVMTFPVLAEDAGRTAQPSGAAPSDARSSAGFGSDPTMRMPPAASASPGANSADEPEPRRRRAPLIAGIAVAAVVVVALVGVVGWTMLRPGQPAQPSQDAQTASQSSSGSSPQGIVLDATDVPDDGVRSALESQGDADGDGALSLEESQAITSLSIEGAADVSGLGALVPNVQTLQVSGDATERVDVADLGSLQQLTVSGPSVSDVDASGSDSLQSLVVTDGAPTVDVTGSDSLADLVVPDGSEVVGLEGTGLAEEWLPVQVDALSGGEELWRTSIERADDGTVQAIREGSFPDGEFGGADGQYLRNTVYYYDGAGELTGFDYYNGPAAEPDGTPDATVSYNEQGQIASISGDGFYAADFAYVDNELTERDEGRGLDASYSYNALGRTTQVKVGNLSTGGTTAFQYEYDPSYRVTGFASPLGTSSETYRGEVSYNDEGLPVSLAPTQGGNGVTATYSYDESGRLVGAEASGEAPSTWTVEYDEAGNPVRIAVEKGANGGDAVPAFEVQYRRFFVPSEMDGASETDAADADAPVVAEDPAVGMLKADREAELRADVVVSPSFGAGGSEALIQPYVLRPQAVRADYQLPVAIDDQYYDQNVHPSL